MPLLGRGDSGFESRRPDKKYNIIVIMKDAYKKVYNFFDKLEDVVRGHLSKYPIVYTVIGGIAIVLFWRGVWHTADILQARGGWLGAIFYAPTNLVIVTVVLLMIGLFVSYFVGDTILISGIKRQKKVTDKTEREVEEEEAELVKIRSTIREMKKEVDEIKVEIDEDHKAHQAEENIK